MKIEENGEAKNMMIRNETGFVDLKLRTILIGDIVQTGYGRAEIVGEGTIESSYVKFPFDDSEKLSLLREYSEATLDGSPDRWGFDVCDVEVIGNVYDDAELLHEDNKNILFRGIRNDFDENEYMKWVYGTPIFTRNGIFMIEINEPCEENELPKMWHFDVRTIG